MTGMIQNDTRVAANRLAPFIARSFVAAGLPAEDAQTLAQLMVEADLRGTDTHGVFRMPLYVRRIKAGGINRHPDIKVIEERPATAMGLVPSRLSLPPHGGR